MSRNYIDYKCTIWKRLHFKDDADMNEVVAAIKKEKHPDYIDLDNLGFVESEVLFDTEEVFPLQKNNNEPTIEVYSQSEEEISNYQDLLWDNNINTIS